MIICKNEKCANFKQELEDVLEICPACGLETARIDSDKDNMKKLAPIVSVVSIIAILATFLLFDFINFYVAFFLGAAIIAACIVLAFITKVKGAIVTTILAAAGFIGIFAYYGLF